MYLTDLSRALFFALVLTIGLNTNGKLTAITGNDDFNNRHWTRLELESEASYETASGGTITPKIEIQCSVSPKDRTVAVYFYTGLTQPDTSFRIKFADNEPDFLAVEAMADSQTQLYFTDPPFSEASKLSPTDLAAKIATSERVAIEFAPIQSANRVALKFDTTKFPSELLKHQECMIQMAGPLAQKASSPAKP